MPELSAQGDAPPAVSTTPATSAAAKAPTIRVRTDVLDMEISTRGGELVRADLLQYPKVKNQPDVPVRL
ncbi:YidC/Oxa1 family insertase periplasmic-domain containing protein, partial [Salmonella enterica]|uniref:YidC/Oxa1 family insertase periplasmic-domain containing protein n=1 Tax=Salmonella enterica TaxID=28901 RepID=UPI003296A856